MKKIVILSSLVFLCSCLGGSKSSSNKKTTSVNVSVEEILTVIAKIRTNENNTDIEKIEALSNDNLKLYFQDGTNKEYTTNTTEEGEDDSGYTLEYMCGDSELGSGTNPAFSSVTLSHNGTESKKLDVLIYEGSCANEVSVSCVILLEKDTSDTIINTYGLNLDLEGGCNELGSRLDSLLSDIDDGDQTGRVYLVNDR